MRFTESTEPRCCVVDLEYARHSHGRLVLVRLAIAMADLGTNKPRRCA